MVAAEVAPSHLALRQEPPTLRCSTSLHRFRGFPGPAHAAQLPVRAPFFPGSFSVVSSWPSEPFYSDAKVTHHMLLWVLVTLASKSGNQCFRTAMLQRLDKTRLLGTSGNKCLGAVQLKNSLPPLQT